MTDEKDDKPQEEDSAAYVIKLTIATLIILAIFYAPMLIWGSPFPD